MGLIRSTVLMWFIFPTLECIVQQAEIVDSADHPEP